MTPREAYVTCNNKTNKDLEPFIIKDPHWAYFYAKNVIKGRWIEAEQYIINNSEWTYFYAMDVIKGKLPENMHNIMLIHALGELSEGCWVKHYLDFIKDKP